jgi:hypothetical protein
VSDTSSESEPKEPKQQKDFCYQCNAVVTVNMVEHATWTEWNCTACGGQTDWLADYDKEHWADDVSEPIGSCENCGTNLYDDDDPEYCGQCLWAMEN